MTFDAGTLTNRITIQRLGPAQDAWGQALPSTWADVATVWASIRHPSGLAAIKGDAQTSEVKASIRIRFRTDVAAGMRVVHGVGHYKVDAVLPDLSRREHVDLVCVKVT